MPSCERALLAALSIYAAAVTVGYLRRPAVSPICERDFADVAAEGSCLCGVNAYCLCTPSLAADVIIELEDAAGRVSAIAFVERKDGRGLAMVGGFVKVGEEATDAARREALEETGLELSRLRQWCTFSNPRRDPRRHTAALVHIARATGTPRAADDAKGIRVVPIEELQHRPPTFAFDHGDIVAAYIARFHPPRGVGGARRLSSAIDRACRPS